MLTSRPSAAFCIATVFGVLAVGCGGAQSRLASHMQRGQAYFAEGNFVKANVEFRNAMQIAPKDPTARLMAGHTAEHLDQFPAAINLYQSVIDSAPDNVEARTSLARLLILADAPQRGFDIIKPALAQHPDNVQLLTLRGAAKLGLKDEDGARADADRALQLEPINEDAVALRAGLYRRSGDLAAAISLVSDAVRQHPSTTALREVLLSLYLSADNPDKADEQLRALIQLKPQDMRHRSELARLYVTGHRIDDAQRVLAEAVKVFPQRDDAKFALVDFLDTQRSPIQAEQMLQGFIARAPDDYDLRLHLGVLMESWHKAAQAIDVYTDLANRADKKPQGIIALDRIAAIQVAAQHYDEASKRIAQVLQQNPRDNEALTLRGQIEAIRNDHVAAIADFRAVLRDQPRAAGVQRLLAHSELANGEPRLAEDALRSAVETAPDDVSLRVEFAQLLLDTQGADASISVLQEGVRRAPDDASVREALVRAYLTKRDFAAARSAADEFVTLHPDLAVGPYLAGMAAQGQNQLDEAQRQFERSLAMQPQAMDVLSALARLKFARGQGDQAVALVKQAVDHEAPNAFAWNLLGELYLAQKNFSPAADAFSHATTLSPKWWVPYRNLALAKSGLNDTAGQISAYSAGLKASAEEPRLAVELASLYLRQGRAGDAIATYEASYQQNPRVQLLASNLAMLLVTYRSDPASLDKARDLTAGFATSNDGGMLDTSGWVHFKRAEYADALPTLQRAIQRAPDSRVIHYHLGMAELQAGHTDRARADLETAVSGSVKFQGIDEARTALAALKSKSGTG